MKSIPVSEYRSMLAPKKRSKYNAVKCEADGHRFDSKAERDRYLELKRLEAAGAIVGLTLQPEFILQEKQPGIRAIKYRGDFMFCQRGQLCVEEVKGFETAVWKLKKKMFEAKYPHIDLRIVSRRKKK